MKKKASIKSSDKSSGEHALRKRMSSNEIRKYLRETPCATSDPEFLFNAVSQKLETNEKFTEKEKDLFDQAVMTLGLDNQYPLAEMVDKKYHGFVLEFARDLTKEYNCKKTSEKALVQIVAIAFARVFEYSKILRRQVASEYLSHERNSFESMLSKEIDRANRHFISALQTLRQFKSPLPEISINTKAAFVGQNQQFNTGKQDETIDPK